MIKFDISKADIVKLSVFDVLRREVATLVNETLIPGTYKIERDASGF